MRRKGVTISDIAEKTGYSKTTVSFAFNWPERISQGAVAKILECAAEMGYHGSDDPSSDPANRYKTLCIFVPDKYEIGSAPIWSESIIHLYNACQARGMMLALIDQKRSGDNHFLKSCAVDAFIFFSQNDVNPALFDVARKRNIPVVGVNMEVGGADGLAQAEKRARNSLECLEMLLQLIKDKAIRIPASVGSYVYLDTNLPQ